MSKSALVTGAAGFIGSHLVDLLLENGYEVTGIDNLDTGRMENLEHAVANNSFKFIKADITEPGLKEKITTDIDYIFHLAAISSVKISVEDPAYVHRVNATGTVNILNLARQIDAQRVVFSSSAAVYGDPHKLPVTEDTPVQALSPYGASKISGEQYMHAFREAFGLETVVLRYFNVFGPRQAYSAYSGVISVFVNRALANDNLIIDGDGLQTRSLIYVGDVVEYTKRAAEIAKANGHTFNIAGNKDIRVVDIADRVLTTVRADCKIRHGPPRVGDVRKSLGSIKHAKSILGYSPKVSFDKGLQMTIDWYRKHQ
ncbi:MAG: SDR family NAD(P)-dependent oxidoreductase [Candidatus Thorarchaeota archaeon]|nr:SDR family NAD(P)-dependent oxidoreductase [Candidatus Thorarchaeota archaeon]